MFQVVITNFCINDDDDDVDDFKQIRKQTIIAFL